MPNRVNDDGSVTTWAEDVDEPEKDIHAKVVTPADQPAPKSGRKAESK